MAESQLNNGGEPADWSRNPASPSSHLRVSDVPSLPLSTRLRAFGLHLLPPVRNVHLLGVLQLRLGIGGFRGKGARVVFGYLVAPALAHSGDGR